MDILSQAKKFLTFVLPRLNNIMDRNLISGTVPVERHPFEPFLPENARILMLGSFPPQLKRWSMVFYYPNFNNDMWRIFGMIFFGDKEHFIEAGRKSFDKRKIVEFCSEKGIAMYDTACEVRRLKDNASDKFLEVTKPTDIEALLARIQECTAIVTTGQKATDVLVEHFGCQIPPMGGSVPFQANVNGAVREMQLFRMPSSSRAYPLAIGKKAEAYRSMLQVTGII